MPHDTVEIKISDETLTIEFFEDLLAQKKNRTTQGGRAQWMISIKGKAQLIENEDIIDSKYKNYTDLWGMYYSHYALPSPTHSSGSTENQSTQHSLLGVIVPTQSGVEQKLTNAMNPDADHSTGQYIEEIQIVHFATPTGKSAVDRTIIFKELSIKGMRPLPEKNLVALAFEYQTMEDTKTVYHNGKAKGKVASAITTGGKK